MVVCWGGFVCCAIAYVHSYDINDSKRMLQNSVSDNYKRINFGQMS